MVVATEPCPTADVVFVIEGTANLGAYLDQTDGLRNNYIIPTLEYFNGGSNEEKEAGLEGNGTMYALVVFMAADCAPEPAVTCYAQTTSVTRFLTWLDQIPFVGGAGEGNSHIAEGLSTAIQVFDDFQSQREPNLTAQKHCILICNSPPYPLPCVESQNYSGYMADQLATLMGERGINLTVISPRKIPALLKLYDKAGGDLQVMQTKNYAKDRRHLILLRGFQLQERPVSPSALEPKPKPPPPDIKPPLTTTNVTSMSANNSLSVPSPQGPGKKRPAGGSPPNAAPPFKQHIMGPIPTPTLPPNQQQTMMPPIQRPMLPNMAAQGIGRPGPMSTAPSSASFLNQPNPPNVTINTKGPLPGMDGSNVTMGMPRPNQVQSPGMRNTWQGMGHPPPVMSHLLNQLKCPVAPSGGSQIGINRTMAPNMVAGHGTPNQTVGPPSVVMVPQPNVSSASSGPQPQQSTLQTQLNMPTSMSMNQANFPNQMTVPSQQSVPQQSVSMTSINSQGAFVNDGINAMAPQGMTQQNVGNLQNQMQVAVQKERRSIWTGMLEWQEKSKMVNDPSNKVTRTLPCQVLSYLGQTGEPEVNADKWPKKLIMQLIPKQLVSSFGGLYLKNSRNVIFQFTSNNDVLDTLNKVMSNGFAGCVHFSNSQCDIRVMILLFSPDKRAYIGFIPNDQTGLVNAIRMAITSHKKQQVVKQQQIIQQGPNPPTQQPQQQAQQQPPQQQQQQQQPNQTTPSTAIFSTGGANNQQAISGMNIATSSASGAMSVQQPPTGVLIAQASNTGGGTTTINMGSLQQQQQQQQQAQQAAQQQQQQQQQAAPSQQQQQAPPPMSALEAERAQNLLKIQQLQQTLEAAQQKELQYKVAQEQQQQQKAVLVRQVQRKEMMIQQHRMNQIQPGAANNNPQLRHLLQHQQVQQMRHQQMLLQQQAQRPQLPPTGQVGNNNLAANLAGTLFQDDNSFLDIQ